MKKLLPLILVINVFCGLFFGITIKQVLAEEKTECDPNTVTSQTSRPAACNLCVDWKPETNTNSCATPFTVSKEVEFEKITPEKIPWRSWYRVDPTSTTIPFVGLSGSESENNYLADYFEGTNEYYANYGNQTTLTNYQGVLRKLTPFEFQNQLKKQLISRIPKTLESGVAFEENQIHNYQVKYVGRLCWDTPFWMDAGRFIYNKVLDLVINSPINTAISIAENIFINKPIEWINKIFKTEIEKVPDVRFDVKIADIGHYCLYDSSGLIVKGLSLFQKITGIEKMQEALNSIPGLIHSSLTLPYQESLATIGEHQPPDPNDEKYKKDYSAYKKDFLDWKYDEDGKWYRLWQAVPMISREDERGEVKAYVENPEMIILFDRTNDDFQVEKVPHLARLYEASKITNQMLTIPKNSEETTIEKHEDRTMACFKEKYTPPTGEGDRLCCNPIEMQLSFRRGDKTDDQDQISVDAFSFENDMTVEIADKTKIRGFENPLFDRCVTELNALREKCASLISFNPINNLSNATNITNCNKDLKILEEECAGQDKEEISQELGVKLTHPYLDLIWQNTSHPNSGLFNIFRPHEIPTFEDIDAASTIKYSNIPEKDSTVEVSPSEGYFFYPHLGGIQKAKEWVVNQALWPKCDKEKYPGCPSD